MSARKAKAVIKQKAAIGIPFSRGGTDTSFVSFQTSPGTPARSVINESDTLLYTAREFMNCIVGGDRPSIAALAYAAEFMANAAHAGYRSVGGEP